MSRTLEYYSINASTFFRDTVGVDMSALHDRLLSVIPEGGIVLDAGCGSGRDAKAFKKRGYRIVAFDASSELAAMAGEILGQPVSGANICRCRRGCFL